MALILSERLLAILREQSISQVDLAGIAGCTRGRINQIIRDADPDEVLSPRYGFPIARKFGYEPEWVMTGNGPVRGITSLNHRSLDLLRNFAKCDERGREPVLLVAEREASYNTSQQ